MSLKADRHFKNSGESCTKIQISFTISKLHIISVIIDLLRTNDAREGSDTELKKIDKKNVEKELRLILWSDGNSFSDYQDEDFNDKKIFHETQLRAEDKAKELFPDFFVNHKIK